MNGTDSLGFGQQTAYSPSGLRWHLWDSGQGDPIGPHVITSVEPITSKGWPIWQGLWGCGRHIGTGGQGVPTHETSARRHVSPSSRQEISVHGSRHSHVWQPESSSRKPCGHGMQLRTGQLLWASNTAQQTVITHWKSVNLLLSALCVPTNNWFLPSRATPPLFFF
jgi:hypothetical protein